MIPVILALLACGAVPDTDHADPHETHETHETHGAPAPTDAPAQPDAHAGHAPPAAGGLAIALDGTKKWQMDQHTRTVMSEIRATLTGAQVASKGDAVALADVLQEQLDRLISGCTMEGAAHDNLHLFLGVYIPALAGLRTTDEPAAQLATLQGLVRQYDDFFE